MITLRQKMKFWGLHKLPIYFFFCDFPQISHIIKIQMDHSSRVSVLKLLQQGELCSLLIKRKHTEINTEVKKQINVQTNLQSNNHTNNQTNT